MPLENVKVAAVGPHGQHLIVAAGQRLKHGAVAAVSAQAGIQHRLIADQMSGGRDLLHHLRIDHLQLLFHECVHIRVVPVKRAARHAGRLRELRDADGLRPLRLQKPVQGVIELLPRGDRPRVRAVEPRGRILRRAQVILGSGRRIEPDAARVADDLRQLRIRQIRRMVEKPEGRIKCQVRFIAAKQRRILRKQRLHTGGCLLQGAQELLRHIVRHEIEHAAAAQLQKQLAALAQRAQIDRYIIAVSRG